VGDKTSLIVAPLAAAAGVVVPMMAGRALGHTGGTLDKLESIPGLRTDLSPDEFRKQLSEIGLCFIGQTDRLAPADRKLYALRDVTGTVESIPLIASSIMSKKLAEGVDALVLDVKVGSGAFMKKQVDARRLAQAMVGIGRRVDKKVQALITDMSQPVGYAVGNALEIMEASQTLHNEGPADLTKLSIELAARMIFLAKKTATLDEARRMAEELLVDGSGYRKFKQAVAAQGGNAQALDRFELLPNATGMREVTSPRAGYVSSIDAEYIGVACNMIGAGRADVPGDRFQQGGRDLHARRVADDRAMDGLHHLRGVVQPLVYLIALQGIGPRREHDLHAQRAELAHRAEGLERVIVDGKVPGHRDGVAGYAHPLRR
jgi:pyrimidine-nucleoside phosphorylase